MTSRREIQAQLDRLDRQIARQLAPMLDHPEFRRLCGAWQGLRYLVRTLEYRGMLRIELLDVTRDELREELAEFSGEGWRRSRPYKLFHDMVYGGFGGEPSVERPIVGAGVTVEYDLDHDRDLVFRFHLESAWKLALRPGGIEVTGRLVR